MADGCGHNVSPGNAGVIFYTNILIPLLGFALLWLQRHFCRSATAAAHDMHNTAASPGGDQRNFVSVER